MFSISELHVDLLELREDAAQSLQAAKQPFGIVAPLVHLTVVLPPLDAGSQRRQHWLIPQHQGRLPGLVAFVRTVHDSARDCCAADQHGSASCVLTAASQACSEEDREGIALQNRPSRAISRQVSHKYVQLNIGPAIHRKPCAMPRGRPLPPLVLTSEQREQLTTLSRSTLMPYGLVQRARIVLSCAQGLTNSAVAKRLDASPSAVGKWRRRIYRTRHSGTA